MNSSNTSKSMLNLYELTPLKSQTIEVARLLVEEEVISIKDGAQDDYEFLQRLLRYAENPNRLSKFIWFAERSIKIIITLDFNVATDGVTLKRTPLISTLKAKPVYGSSAYESRKTEPATVEECFAITKTINTMLDLEESEE